MNYAQIRAFHCAAREGSLMRAAQVLGVSQPTVSQHIKALEARHGVRLFERRGRGQTLTLAGRSLLGVTERLMSVVDEVEAALHGPAALTSGSLSVMADSTALAAELLRRFAERHPAVELTLGIASVAEISEAVLDGAADAGIAMDPPVGDALTLLPLTRERFWVTLPRGHRLAGGGPAPLRALAEERLIMREPGSRTRALVLNALSFERVPIPPMIVIRERSAIREAVARGMGAAFFCRSECPPDARLAHVPLTAESARLDFDEHLMIRADRRRQPIVAALHEIAAEFARERREADADALARGREGAGGVRGENDML